MAPELNPLPEDRFPVDEWKIIETSVDPDLVGRMETVFALGNGYLGMRGTYDEMAPISEPGTFVNGYYESWPIVYPEAAYGFASAGQTIVNVPDVTAISLSIDGIEMGAATASTRTLDMARGVLERTATWQTDSGAIVTLTSTRLVSLEHRHLAAIRWEVAVDGGEADVVVGSAIERQLLPDSLAGLDHHDPRRARKFDRPVLEPVSHRDDRIRITNAFRTPESGLSLACAVDHEVAGPADGVAVAVSSHDDGGSASFAARITPENPLVVVKFAAFHASGDPDDARSLMDAAEKTLDAAIDTGFEALLGLQRAALDEAWSVADVRVPGKPRLQQAVRWGLFQLIQATRLIERSGVPAKGLTSRGYDGHYFWDMDMFFMPFVVHTRPDLARELLLYRYETLDAARERAAEMSETGALYPWRTINGMEASAFFPAGTAQYHINAAVAYAIKRYDEVTGDADFLLEHGAEIVLETARTWYSLGFFGRRGRFHLHGVTGPDEYTALVNNNTYTNLMAQLHLTYAADLVDRLARDHPERHLELMDRIGLGAAEVAKWRLAAEAMTVLYDDDLRIHAQDAEFLDLEVWDFANTSEDEYPLLLHHHPLVLYRHQVLKQSDVVLAMVLRGDLFDDEQKARNFAYYEPLTTDDSSLSTPIQAIIAAEVGAHDVAARCFEMGVYADLADVYGNASDGVHLAAAGASWMTLVMGFGGMRDYDGGLSFDPRLPPDWDGLEFTIRIRGRLLDVALDHRAVSLTMREGPAMELGVAGKTVTVEPDKTTSVPIRRT